MKKILFIAIVLIIASCNQGKESKEEKENKTTEEIAVNPNLKLQIYYFHSTRRCPTCNKIESTTEKLLQTEFAQKMEEGVIAFSSINIDKKENNSLVEKYEVFGSSLHLVEIIDGKEKDIDLTEFAFSNINSNTDLFYDELKKKITEIIN